MRSDCHRGFNAHVVSSLNGPDEFAFVVDRLVFDPMVWRLLVPYRYPNDGSVLGLRCVIALIVIPILNELLEVAYVGFLHGGFPPSPRCVSPHLSFVVLRFGLVGLTIT